MNILPKKSWHVYSIKNKEKVLKDEREHAILEEKNIARKLKAERENKIELLRNSAQKKYLSDHDDEHLTFPTGFSSKTPSTDISDNTLQHVDLFKPREIESSLRLTKSEKEKEERLALEKKYTTFFGENHLKEETPWYSQSLHKNKFGHDEKDLLDSKRWKNDDPINQFIKSKLPSSASIKTKSTRQNKLPDIGISKNESSIENLRKKRLERERKERRRESHLLRQYSSEQ